MKYIIIGLGNYGGVLAEELSMLGNEVIGVDMNSHHVELLKDKIAASFIMDATEEEALSALPLREVDVVIVAIGENLGASVRTIAILKKMEVKRIMARAVDEVHKMILEAFGLDRILTPEKEAARTLVRLLDLQVNVESFPITETHYVAMKERQVLPGDEIITLAAGFPTTVTPIIQYGAIPVFVDVTIPEYNIDVAEIRKAISPKTKGIMIAHTLGNPFNLEEVLAICKEHNLWLIEDNCDALGSQYYINGEWKYTGTIGDIGTSSFYPPHHMTMGEGGAVYTNDALLGKIMKSMRDWGRDCVSILHPERAFGFR